MKKRFLSLIIALAMMVGVFTPLLSSAEETTLEQTTKKVTVHKLIPVNKDTSADDIKKQIEDLSGDKKYTGRKLDLATDVNKAKEIKDVYFVWTNGQDQVIDEDGNVLNPEVKITNNKLPEGTKELPATVLGGLTGDNGKEFDTSKLKAGTYKIYEIHSLSKYVGENGETLTKMLAVPVEITLPLNDVEEAHVYPKNVQEAPKIDKNFDNEDNKTGETVNAKGIKQDELTDPKKDVEINTAADKYQREKGTAKKQLGDKVPYKVVTEIPADTKWATAKWDDKMTEGLTYNKDLTIELKKGNVTVELKAEEDYKINNENNGFILEFTKVGLEKLNNKPEKQTITLKYTATLNEKAVPDVEESNDVTFHYGNKPGHGNTPIPNKPNKGKMEFTKSWVNEEGNTITPPEGASVEVQLYNANTGEKFGEAKTLNAGNQWKVEWTGLDNETEYKVVETSVKGYEAEYTKGDVGVLGVKNWKSDNPTPLNPSEPKVVTGGKKFVKTNNEEKTSEKLERLAGAEFLVKNAKKEYLAHKSKATSEEEKNALKAAKDAYEKAIEAWNTAVEENKKLEEGKRLSDDKLTVTIGEETITGKKAAEEKIASLLKAYNEALKADENAYEWVTDKKAPNVVTLISKDEGKFEIKGLAYGKYTLEEIKAPAGYALPTGGGNFSFEVKEGSYKGYDPELQYNKEDTNNGYGQQIKNSNVTIPQTGGIGTIIFTAIGLAIMASAVIAIKKRQATEAR